MCSTSTALFFIMVLILSLVILSFDFTTSTFCTCSWAFDLWTFFPSFFYLLNMNPMRRTLLMILVFQIQSSFIDLNLFHLFESFMTTTEGEHKPPKKIAIAFSVILIIFLLVMVGIYGPLALYYKEKDLNSTLSGISITFLHLLFTLVGFGLLLTNSSRSRWSGLAIALFVVSFNFVMSPLMEKWWYQVFFGFASQENIDTPAMATEFWNKHEGTGSFNPSDLSIRLSNFASISFLVAMTGVIGRVHFLSLFSALVLFNLVFYLNFYLCTLVSFSTAVKDGVLEYLDDYGTIIVYLFGGIVGIIAGFLNKVPRADFHHDDPERSKTTYQFSILGGLFLFANFIVTFTSIIDGLNAFRLNSGALMMVFGLSAGVLGSFIGCALAGKGYITPRSFNVGLISGGIMSGILAGEYNNFGIAIMLGLIAGIISGIFITKVTPKMNEKSIVDSQGLLGPIVVVGFLAAFVVAPCMLNQFFRRDDIVISKGKAEEDFRVARYHLSYLFITIGIAAILGLVVGKLLKAGDDRRRYFRDSKFFASGYGLCDKHDKQENHEVKYQEGSGSHINKDIEGI